MKKIKPLNILQTLIALIFVFGVNHIISQYDEINSFYIQEKENYTDLKKLNSEILKFYNVDLTNNNKLNELNKKIEYNEHMINNLEPYTEFAKYYWWILIGLTWILILSIWINRKSENKTE